jgi:hypothetical protein
MGGRHEKAACRRNASRASIPQEGQGRDRNSARRLAPPAKGREAEARDARLIRLARSVLGYRTVMYIDDDVGGPFAQSIGNVAPAVSAWLNTLSSASAYSGNPTYPD